MLSAAHTNEAKHAHVTQHIRMQLHFGVCDQELTVKEFREGYHQQNIKGMLTYKRLN